MSVKPQQTMAPPVQGRPNTGSRPRRAGFMTATGLLLIAYLVVCGYIWHNQPHHIFSPQRSLEQTPADYQLPYQDLFIAVAGDNGQLEQLHGWWISPSERPARILLYLHGSALNIEANIAHARRFFNMGFAVLLLSYRGYGISGGGFPSEQQVNDDAQAAWHYLTRVKNYDAGQIFIYGHSLGGAVAIELAVNHPDAAGLITEATFTSIVDMARRKWYYRLLPLDWIVHQRFDSLSKVRRLNVPVLYLHGTADELVPYSMSRRLYARTASSKYLELIPGGGHNNSAAVGGQTYLAAVKIFLAAVAQKQLAR